MKNKGFQNILILGHANMGDVLHNMAVFKPLHLAFPEAKLSILTSQVGKSVLDENPYLSEILIFDKYAFRTSSLKEKWLWIKELRRKKIDLIINLKSGSFLGYFLGAKKVWNIRRQDKSLKAKQTTHAIDLYLNVLRHHGLTISKADLDLKVTYLPQDREKVESLLSSHPEAKPKDPIVIFAPFSAWHAKEWNLVQYGELAKKLSVDHNRQIIFVGGSNDVKKMEMIQDYKPYFIDLVGQLSLKELAALYDEAELVIGADSGPFHLASNMERKALGIFAPTTYFRGRPYFEPNNIVFCDTHLGCNPCIPGGKFMACKVWNRTTPCMEEISFDNVYRKTREIILAPHSALA